MKKIIFAALSVLMILSLVGCGEHIDYTPNKAFSTGDVAGVMNGWPTGNTSNWTTADDDNYVYTYEFTALKEMGTTIQFKVRSTAGKWDTGDFGGAKLDTKGTKAELTPADFGGPSAEFEVEASHKYKITVTSEDGKVYGKVEDLGLDVVPMPFVLNGMAISIDGAAPTLDTALMSFEKDLKGNLTYKKVIFVATATEHKFNITDAVGEAIYGSTSSVAVGGDAITLSTAKVNDEVPAVKITGLKADDVYAITVVTTPEEVVTASVAEAPIEVTFTFEVTNMGENTDAWMNGTFWGEAWPNGWKQTSWNSTPKAELVAPTVADGVATFNETWNVVVKAKPNEVLNFSFKTQVTKGDWSDDDKCSSPANDQTLEFTVTKEGTVKVTINASTWAVSAAYVE